MKSNLKNDCPTKYHNKNNFKFQEQKSYFMIGVCVYIYISNKLEDMIFRLSTLQHCQHIIKTNGISSEAQNLIK